MPQQAQTTEATNQESLQLVKCLIRVSVYHVCWMRDLFPESYFSGHNLPQLDQLHVKMLEPDTQDDEAGTLKQWVEQGVMDAVSKGYLKNMYFGISQDPAGTHVLEEYVYNFSYGKDRVEFDMEAGASGKNKMRYTTSSKTERPRVDDAMHSARHQVVCLMRMLVRLCQTLDKVPDQHYIFMKLTYHDHTPVEYEPPCFHACEGMPEEGTANFHRRPFSMDVGGMDTHAHNVSVRVKSVLDSWDSKHLQRQHPPPPQGLSNNPSLSTATPAALSLPAATIGGVICMASVYAFIHGQPPTSKQLGAWLAERTLQRKQQKQMRRKLQLGQKAQVKVRVDAGVEVSPANARLAG